MSALLRNLRWLIEIAVIALGLWLFYVLFSGSYLIHITTLAAIYTTAALGLNLSLGLSGQLSLGHAAFFALGGYTSALLASDLSLPFWASAGLGVLASAIVAVIVGSAAVRLEGYYLSLATLAFGVILFTLAGGLSDLTGGPSGRGGIPTGPFTTKAQAYAISWGLCIAGYYFARRLAYSVYGRALVATHSNPAAAEACGIPTSRLKLAIFILSAVYAGAAGVAYAHYSSFISPAMASLSESIDFLIMVMLGGLGSPAGGILGGLGYLIIRELAIEAHEYRYYVRGFMLLVILLYFPGGLEHLLRSLQAQARRWGRGPRLDDRASGQEG